MEYSKFLSENSAKERDRAVNELNRLRSDLQKQSTQSYFQSNKQSETAAPIFTSAMPESSHATRPKTESPKADQENNLQHAKTMSQASSQHDVKSIEVAFSDADMRAKIKEQLRSRLLGTKSEKSVFTYTKRKFHYSH